MNNRKHMRTEKKTAVKTVLGGFWLQVYLYLSRLHGWLIFYYILQGLCMDFIIKHIYCNYSCA